MMIPLVIGMSAALALAALVFALRSGASLGGLSQFVSRLTTPRGRHVAATGYTRDAEQPANSGRLGQDVGDVALQSTRGGKSFSIEGGRVLVVGRGHSAQITIDDDTVSSMHARLQLDSAGDRRHHQRSRLVERHLPQRQAHHHGARAARRCDAVRHRGVQAGGGRRLRLSATPTPRSAPNDGWMLSGFDPSGRALQFELRPMVENGSAGEAATTLDLRPRQGPRAIRHRRRQRVRRPCRDHLRAARRASPCAISAPPTARASTARCSATAPGAARRDGPGDHLRRRQAQAVAAGLRRCATEPRPARAPA